MHTFKKQLLHVFTLLTIFLLASNTLFAHFGSKGPFGGSVSVAIAHDSTVYLGTFTGGVYESTNSTLTAWRARPVGLGSGQITALAHSGSYLFAGTADDGVYIFNGYIGSDRYWNKINNGLASLQIRSLVALDSITLLVGTAGGGLYKTTNKGATWTSVSSPSLNGKNITALVKAANRIVLTTLDGGVFFSTDNGSNWTSLNDAHTLNVGGTVSLSYNAATNELAVINNNGLFVLANASTTTTANYTAAQAGLPTGIALRSIANNGTNWYLATDQGVFTTTTSLVSWTATNAGLPGTDVTAVVNFRTDLIAGVRKEGIFKSSANNVGWVRRNTNFNNLATYAMEASGDKVIIAATENGVFVSRDLASAYVRANTGLTDSLNVTYLRFFGANLYASTRNAGIFVSADTGRTWQALNSGLINLNIKKIFASNTDLYLLDSSNGLFHYASSGWTSIQAGLPTNAEPTSMTFYGSKVLLGTLGQGVFTREAANGSWSAANTGLSNLRVTSVTTNGSKIFAGTDGAGVFVAEPDASNWNQAAPTSIAHTVTMGLDGTKIQDMGYYAGYVFASYQGGLLATSNNGSTWIAGGNQFNLPSYTNVWKIAFVTTRVFVSTEHNSLYSNALSELPVVSAVNDISQTLGAAIGISPNPNNGHFAIQMKDTNAKVEAVSIFDNTGKLVQYLAKPSDLQDIRVSATCPAGIYLVRIQTNEGMAVKKIIIE